jgi:hypothetical protein
MIDEKSLKEALCKIENACIECENWVRIGEKEDAISRVYDILKIIEEIDKR